MDLYCFSPFCLRQPHLFYSSILSPSYVAFLPQHSCPCPVFFQNILSFSFFNHHLYPLATQYHYSLTLPFLFYVGGMFVLNSTTTLSSSNLLCQNIPIIPLLHPSLLSSSGNLWWLRKPSRKVQH